MSPGVYAYAIHNTKPHLLRIRPEHAHTILLAPSPDLAIQIRHHDQPDDCRNPCSDSIDNHVIPLTTGHGAIPHQMHQPVCRSHEIATFQSFDRRRRSFQLSLLGIGRL